MPRAKPKGVQRRRDSMSVTPLQWARLWDDWRPGQELPQGVDEGDHFEAFMWSSPGQGANLLSLEEAWRLCRETILRRWVRARPGTRPEAWWHWDAPRWEGDPFEDCWYHGTLPLPRQRIGGTGTPAYEALAYGPSFTKGIPDRFVTRGDVELYNGRSLGVDGKPLYARHRARYYQEGDFPHEAWDPEDPPLYEAEATYLKRLGLLFEGEEERIPAEGWEPEPAPESRPADWTLRLLPRERDPEGEPANA